MSSVRPARSADLDALAALEAEVFATDAWSRQALAGQLGRHGGVALVLECGGEIVACALGWAAGGASELLRIAVHPDQRRQGAARTLLDDFVSACRGRRAEELWLEVRADNAPAIALYRAAGMRSTGLRPAYYTDGTDALLMELSPLQPPLSA